MAHLDQNGDSAIEIAKSIADILNGWSSGTYDTNEEVKPGFLGREEMELCNLKQRIYDLAKSRTTTTVEEFALVYRATEFEVNAHIARFLTEITDPLVAGLEIVEIEEKGEVCAICQEEMEVGEKERTVGCSHKFHACCIVQWVKEKDCCPICRFDMGISSSGKGKSVV